MKNKSHHGFDILSCKTAKTISNKRSFVTILHNFVYKIHFLGYMLSLSTITKSNFNIQLSHMYEMVNLWPTTEKSRHNSEKKGKLQQYWVLVLGFIFL